MGACHVLRAVEVAETPESLNDLVPGAGDMLRLAQRKQDEAQFAMVSRDG